MRILFLRQAVCKKGAAAFNYILMISGSKIFSYAGQRIAIAAISDKLYPRHYPALKQRYGMGRLGDAYAGKCSTFLIKLSRKAIVSSPFHPREKRHENEIRQDTSVIIFFIL